MKSQQPHLYFRRALRFACLVTVTTGFFNTALASDSEVAPAAQVDLSAVTVINVANPQKMRDYAVGQRVYIDPDTKEIREATLEEMHEVAKENIRNRESLKARPAATLIPAKSGARGARMSAAYRSYSVVTRNNDGTLSEVCVTGQEAANKSLAAGTAKSNHEEKGATHERE
jgi:hypothetical protein